MPNPALTISAACGMFWFTALFLLGAPVAGAAAFGLISFAATALALGVVSK